MRVMLDACVLYPTVMREVLLGCAKAGLYEPRWSPRILEEWARAAAKLGPGDEVYARGEITGLGVAFPDASITHDAQQEAHYWLPDPADIHVLTAAVVGSCDGILTANTKDFPRNILAEEGLLRFDPDGFVIRLHHTNTREVEDVAKSVLEEARRLSGEDWTIRALFKKARLPRLGKALAG